MFVFRHTFLDGIQNYIKESGYLSNTISCKAPNSYKLVWSDEFNSDNKPNKKYWSYESGFVRNNELQWYQPENATISNGHIVIEGKREEKGNINYKKDSKNWRINCKNAHYTSSCIDTRNKFSFKYGIMEVRARLDTSLGSWPAIWILGEDRKWPSKGEVDLMEFYRHNGSPKILANAA